MATADDLLIENLRVKVELSVRASNICEVVGIKTLAELHEHVLKYGNFLNIRNCGRRTNIELLEFHKQLYDNFLKNEVIEKEPEEKVEAEELIEINSLSEANFQLLYKVEFDKLSVRAQNALLILFNYEIPTRAIIKGLFIDQEFNPRKLRNIGLKTVTELKGFINRLIDLFKRTKSTLVNPSELAILKLKEMTGVEISEAFYFDLFQKREFPIIGFTSKYLSNILDIKEVDEFILRNHFGLLESELTMEEIGDKFKLTRERIRQKRDILIERCEKIFRRLTEFLPYSKYGVLFHTRLVISLPEDLPNDDTEIEEVGILFSTYFLGQIVPDYYSLCTLDRIKKPAKISRYENYKQYKNIHGCFLVRNIVPKEKLMDLFEALLEKLSAKLSEDTYLDIKQFFEGELDPQQYEVISLLVKEEFELDIKDSIICVPRNTNKLAFEFAREALEQIGRPAHISEICAVIRNNYPEFDSPDNSVQSTIGRHKDIFIYFGRTSTFGLRAWENQYKNIKGGTIRDIAEDFLKDYDQPCHISAITEYVNKYRKTDETSVMSNLKMTVNNRFVFFKDAYVGLVSKNYTQLNQRDQGNSVLPKIRIDDLLHSIFSNGTEFNN